MQDGGEGGARVSGSAVKPPEELVPSLRDSHMLFHFTRHCRAGLSHFAATRLLFVTLLDFAGENEFAQTLKGCATPKNLFTAGLKNLRKPADAFAYF